MTTTKTSLPCSVQWNDSHITILNQQALQNLLTLFHTQNRMISSNYRGNIPQFVK